MTARDWRGAYRTRRPVGLQPADLLRGNAGIHNAGSDCWHKAVFAADAFRSANVRRKDTEMGMFFRFAPYMRKWVQRSRWNIAQFGSSNGALWTRCGSGPFSGERDSLAER
jgi:hypothetical protein